jgi:hypothetical protein
LKQRNQANTCKQHAMLQTVLLLIVHHCLAMNHGKELVQTSNINTCFRSCVVVNKTALLKTKSKPAGEIYFNRNKNDDQ